MSTPYFQVDAFTSRPFSGNPAAVFLLDSAAPDHWMQMVAMELNLSESAFLYPEQTQYRLRWFTPAVEIDLCGHATLASAHILYQNKHVPLGQPVLFATRSGMLTAISQNGHSIELDFPAQYLAPVEAPSQLFAALKLPISKAYGNVRDYLIEVKSPDIVRSLQPDFELLKGLPLHGVIVTSRSDDPAFDFISRFFAPSVGVNEDPVTGSAHCALAPYWHEKLGKPTLTGFQASPRGGIVGVRHEDDRVVLIGTAQTVAKGAILVEQHA